MFWNTFSKAPWENTRHPGLRTTPSLRARSGTLLQGNPIRSGPEGAQGVLGFAALSLSFSLSSVSLPSIFDLIVFPAPCGRAPLRDLDFFFLFCFYMLFSCVVFISHFLFWSLFWLVSIFWVSLFRAWNLYRFHRFGNGFRSHFWCFFDACTVRTFNLLNHQKNTCFFTMNFDDLTIQKNIIFNDVHDLFRYKFWHWYLMSLGIDSGSILGPLWHQIPCFRWSFFWRFFEYFLFEFW